MSDLYSILLVVPIRQQRGFDVHEAAAHLALFMLRVEVWALLARLVSILCQAR